MKTLVLSMISIAATIAAMTACTSEGDPIDNIDNAQPVEIQLNAGIVATTKAAVPSTLTADLDVMFIRATDAASADWTTATPLFAKIAKDSPNGITFYTTNDRDIKSKQYYNTSETLPSWLAGYYIDNLENTSTDKNKIKFTITGNEDILATKGLSGTKKVAFQSFTFNHLLSQVEITLKGDAAAQANYGEISKVELTNLATGVELTLSENAPVIAANGSETSTIEIFNNTSTGVNITADGNTLTNIPMIYKTGTTLNLNVYLKNDQSTPIPVTATITDGLESGKKHAITLNFKEKITATASITAWDENGHTGSGEVD